MMSSILLPAKKKCMLYIPNAKGSYKDQDIGEIPSPELLYVPLAPYKWELVCVLQKGDRVLRNQVLAQSTGDSAFCLHASVSGLVGEVVDIDGYPHIEIYNDFKNERLVCEPMDLSRVDRAAFISRLAAYGIEGSGGARFPTSLKYSFGAHSIETLIINGAECEPYLSADYVLMKFYSDALAEAAAFIQRLFEIKQVVIAIERQHKKLRPILEQSLLRHQVQGRVHLLPDSYPQGGELQLIKSVTSKVISKGTLPASQGILMNNVGTLYAIYTAFFEARPYTERLVTLYDELNDKGMNCWVPIGTPISHLANAFFKPTISNYGLGYILGGPMMGRPISDSRTPMNKGTAGLLRMKERKSNISNCIGCGYCADVCPQHLLPWEFSRNTSEGRTDKLAVFNLMDCIECGACAFVCPSEIPLVQDIRRGKILMKN